MPTQTRLLLGIALADLITTVFLMVDVGWENTEANPLFNYILHCGGLAGFCVAKLILIICPILILEYARQHKPLFVKGAVTWAIRGYVGLYLAGLAWANLISPVLNCH